MYIKSLFHILPSGQKAIFTIHDMFVDGELFFYALVFDPELEIYKNKTDQEKQYCGIKITNGNQQPIYYRDSDLLISDILTKYGREGLETER